MTPQQLVQEVDHLFSLPDVAVRLNELIDQPDTSTKQLVDVVQLDAGIAATVLRLANSAWYGLPSRVDTISRAITLIGLKALRDLVLSTSVITTFKGISSEFVDMMDFWDNSVTCGVVTRNLAQRCGVKESERMFLAGLLHKVGRLVFYISRPVQYRQVLMDKDMGEPAVVEAEHQVFGFSHAELGGALLRHWRVPEALDEVIAYQLNPFEAPYYQKEASILHMAADMAFHMAPDIKARGELGEYNLTFDEDVWASLGQPRESIAEIMQSSLIQSFELLEIVNPRG
ncbi:MAG TPA: HDOD domain-containing protein [Thiobacillaceae bacterium]|nr:HDOD domain-containing protein [Thiobacillaceae bacterium]HNA80952.1 HDOD domain-containing protein [Thiobacillaceae bacterium]HNF88223.1 HDOD domain-containing protein [Thiobacillaceae bacterium]HNH88781.1 HDOD domain-containing protein [Thiobacillaceae bacterium]HNI07893.1 HDOD domain-containing protein [Thiobacillaceae bacterium]